MEEIDFNCVVCNKTITWKPNMILGETSSFECTHTKFNSEKQTSLAELHRLNITLANYFDVAPYILGGNKQNDNSISNTSETKTATGTASHITV